MRVQPLEAEVDVAATEASCVAFARDLVEIQTENPPGVNYADCVERIVAELDALSLAYEIVETGDEIASRQTIIARTGHAGPLLYLHGHYDVVPAFDTEQFSPRIVDGCLTGRGSTDMKSGLAAIVYAASDAAAAGANVALVIVPDEETGGRLGSERLAALGHIDPAAVGAIVAEPTWGTVWHACRGAFTLLISVQGVSAHVGLHYEGRNAFLAAVEVADELRVFNEALKLRTSEVNFASTHPRARDSILLIGGVAEGGTNFNIVPERFAFTVDRRPNADEDYEAAKAELLARLEAIRDRGIDLAWEVLQDANSALTPADDHFVSTVLAAASAISGREHRPTCCPGVLETRIYSRLGIPAVAYGPGLIDHMHGPDEFVPLANIAAARRVYATVADRLTASVSSSAT
jgi:acetylornithine deacetylase/succinyl-diaminopimelate desuccinylase-like protein